MLIKSARHHCDYFTRYQGTLRYSTFQLCVCSNDQVHYEDIELSCRKQQCDICAIWVG